jgi:acyl-CoA synthetase (NDP forming)
MKVNYPNIIDQCIDEGVKHALNNTDGLPDSVQLRDRLADVISKEIWIQLDYYFKFED